MQDSIQAAPVRKHSTPWSLTFINYSNDNHDQTRRNLNLINRHCSKVAHQPKRISLRKTRAIVLGGLLSAHVTPQSKPRFVPGRSLLVTSDQEFDHEDAEGTESSHIEQLQGRDGRFAPDIQALTYKIYPSTDYFSRVPIVRRGHVQIAFEYFIHEYAPRVKKTLPRQLAVKSSDPGSNPSPISGFDTFVQVLSQDAMLFEQMVAYLLLIKSVCKHASNRMTPEMLHHSNRSLGRLRERLQGGETGEAVIMTIVTLAAIHLTCGEYAAMDAHVRALRNLVALAGGYANIGWDGLLELRIKQ